MEFASVVFYGRLGEQALAMFNLGDELTHWRGAAVLEWSTEPGNATAQRLYDSIGAGRSEWVSYEIEL